MKPTSKCLSFLIACLFFGASAYAATVTGTVKGPDGAPFRGAFVQARNAGTRVLVSVLTDKEGHHDGGRPSIPPFRRCPRLRCDVA